MNTLPPDETTPENRAWQEWVERIAVGDPVEVDGAAGVVVGIGDNGVMVRFAKGAEPVPCSWDSLAGAPASVATDAALSAYYKDGAMTSLRAAIAALSNEIDSGGPDPVNVRDGLLLSCLVDERDNLNFAKRLGWTDTAQDGIGWALGELGRVRALLADAELALRMTRGDGWPAGWRQIMGGWVLDAGNSQWTISRTVYGKVSDYRLTGPSIWSRGPDGPIRTPSHESTHPDPLSALRAYEAVVKP